MIIYDFEFGAKDNQTKIALQAYLEAKKTFGKDYPIKEFHITTFNEDFIHNISRINPISAKTILTDLHAYTYIKTFFTAIDKSKNIEKISERYEEHC